MPLFDMPLSRPAEGQTARRLTQPVAATLSLLILAALIVVSISPNLYFERWDFPLNASPPRDLHAPFTVTVIDRAERDRLRAEERAKVKIVYVMDVQAAAQAKARVREILAILDAMLPPDAVVEPPDEPEAPPPPRLAAVDERLRAELGVDLSLPTLITLAAGRNSEQFRRELEGVFDYLLLQRGLETTDRADTLMSLHREGRVEIVPRGGPRPFGFEPSEVLDESEAPTTGVNQYLEFHSLLRSRDQREALREVVAALITGNLFPDEEETERRLRAAENSIPPSQYSETYEKGQLIVAAGRTPTAKELLALREIDAQKPFYLMLNFVGNAALVAYLLTFLLIYVKRARAGWAYTPANVNVLGLPLVLTLLLARAAHLLVGPAPTMGYLFPAPALGMLSTILVGPRVGLLVLFSGCCLYGFMDQMSFQSTIVGIAGGAAAVSALSTLRRRRDILRAGLVAGLINAAAILTLRFIDNPAFMVFRDWSIGLDMGFGLINGLASSMITLMGLVVFEHLFRVTTDLNLIELTSLRTPLMRELEQKTPGTYQHTLNVTKLAEAAAEAIGANYLLVRAGAHYHDIGKMAKPKYFTENQATAEERRIHSKLAPSLSALIIKEHVKKGIELARQHRLPDKVVEFIPMHHGTSLIKYFYTEAQRRFAMGETSDEVPEEEFRYPGPKPQTAETAILMLADAVEATATSKMTGTVVRRDDVERLVRDTIREKFNDGQLDECNLTLADLHQIRESFVKSLLARYHQRVDYPQPQVATRA